jgi:hypothetical protein
MKKRKEFRVKKNLLANIDVNGYEEMAVIGNFSRSGMFIASTEIFPPQSRLSILVAVADELFSLAGEVIWSIRSPNKFSDNTAGGMGIKLTQVQDNYIQFVENTLTSEEKVPSSQA